MKNVTPYGLLFASAIFLWAIIETLLGLHDQHIRYHEYLSYFFAVPSVYIIYRGIRMRKKQLDDSISFREAFPFGLGITVIATLLSPLVWYVFCGFINPAFLDNMKDYAIETRQVDAKWADQRFSLANHMLISAFSTLIIGTIISLVIAIVVREKT